LISKLVKKRKIGQENFFLLNVCRFCREKKSKNSGRGSASAAVFRPKLSEKDQFFSPNPRSGVGFFREKKFWPGRPKFWSLGSAIQPKT
jgi:hypothetical protein